MWSVVVCERARGFRGPYLRVEFLGPLALCLPCLPVVAVPPHVTVVRYLAVGLVRTPYGRPHRHAFQIFLIELDPSMSYSEALNRLSPILLNLSLIA